MKMKPLAEQAIEAVENGRIEFVPANWAKTYFEWMYNIRDWCISRQLWWGHRIPAWHCGECNEMIVAREDPTACPRCGSDELKQDTDVLDTWFSSGLWPFSTLGWPDQTEDLARFYPTSLLITGFDILFFWVARMIMLGCEFMGDVPFRQVHIHGLVRDAETAEDVQDQGQRGRSAGGDGKVRHGRGADGAVAGRGSGHRYRADGRAHGEQPRVREQDLERGAVPVHERAEDGAVRRGGARLPIEDRWIFSRLNAAAEPGESRDRSVSLSRVRADWCGTSSGTSSATGIWS